MIVAAHRQDRPWKGETVATVWEAVPSYDPACTFCPGNRRVSGAKNPDYTDVFVFDNDHPCVGALAPEPTVAAWPLATASAAGVARVVCFDPGHDRSLSALGVAGVARVLAAFRDEERRFEGRDDLAHVLMFENRGPEVGVSNPHPHGQLYATPFVFKTMETEARVSARHHAEHGRSVLEDVVAAEETDGRRILFASDGAVAFVPHFARYAYEVFVVPRAPRPRLARLDDGEINDLAAALVAVLEMYDRLWERPFPYVLAIHSGPLRGESTGFHAHVELHPPLRKPGLLKYLAGPEVGGGGFLADTAPEAKAAELRGD